MTVPYIYAARVVRVIDGDSLVLRVDLGLRTWHESPFRLAGIDAPEVGAAGPEGEAARDYLATLLPVGEVVVIQTRKSPEKFGRWLCVITVGDGTNVNDRMVGEGHARRYDGGAR